VSKNVAVFVDVANIFYAAKAAGVDIDYVTLLKSASAGRDLVRAYAYTGLDPENDNQRQFHAFLARSGYKVVSKDIRKYGDGKVKANLDIELVVDMMKTARNLDIAVIISGDGDFAPAIRAVQEMGVRVEVISFRGNTSSDLIEVADLFTDITQIARVEKGSSRSGRRVAGDDEDLSMTEVPDKQTEGTGVNIYTHGEMLPAHGYPGLKKYAHLAGNFGGAWQDQHKELAVFPGAIIFNTNCIQKPAESYKDRLFTWGLVRWPGVKHVDGWDFSAVIAKAKECEGFPENPGREILTGFGHNAVLGVADKIIAAVKSGAIRRFFLIGGCDGAKPGRNYYTELAEKAPKDTVILTLACGKYRFNKLEFGDIGGIPRLLDVGQCNDSYSAVRIALALADAFECGVNDLPLSIILSWYEQKAVAVLLTLLHLGIRNIRIGPSLPAFVTPNVLAFLVENFNLTPVGTADGDLNAILGDALGTAAC